MRLNAIFDGPFSCIIGNNPFYGQRTGQECWRLIIYSLHCCCVLGSRTVRCIYYMLKFDITIPIHVMYVKNMLNSQATQCISFIAYVQYDNNYRDIIVFVNYVLSSSKYDLVACNIIYEIITLWKDWRIIRYELITLRDGYGVIIKFRVGKFNLQRWNFINTPYSYLNIINSYLVYFYSIHPDKLYPWTSYSTPARRISHLHVVFHPYKYYSTLARRIQNSHSQ